MDYIILKSPILGKYGIFTQNSEQIVPFQYDYILSIIDNKWAVVAKKYRFTILDYDDYGGRTDFWQQYAYGLIDLNNNVIFDMSYDLLWVKQDIVYVMKDDIVNEKMINGKSIWHSKYGLIFLDNWIVYQDSEFAVLEINHIDDIRDNIKYIVIDVNFNTIEEFDDYLCVKNKYLSKKIMHNNLIDIFPEKGGGFLCPKEWELFHFRINEFNNANLSVNNHTICDITNYKLYSNNFMYVETLTGKSFIFNKQGCKIFEAEHSVLIQEMGRILNKIVINGVFILKSNGDRYAIATRCNHMFSYEADGNGFIKIIDTPNLMPILDSEKKSANYKYFGLMDEDGNEIAPIIYPSPVFDSSYSESYGIPNYSDDLSDAFDGDSDALWNID